MLVLQRKSGESVRIGDRITVSVLSVDGNRVRIAIDAPAEIPILRSELLEAKAANRESVIAAESADGLLSLLGDVLQTNPEKGGSKL